MHRLQKVLGFLALVGACSVGMAQQTVLYHQGFEGEVPKPRMHTLFVQRDTLGVSANR